jgi:hypothetical protein
MAGQRLACYLNVLQGGPTGADFSVGDTVPLVDGQFVEDGMGLALSDACGRVVFFGANPQERCEGRLVC